MVRRVQLYPHSLLSLICATFTVPLDHSNMNSAKFILAFVIVHPFMLQFTNEFSLVRFIQRCQPRSNISKNYIILQRPKYFKVERAGPCKPALRLGGKLEKFDLSQPTKNRFHLDADIRILAVNFICSCSVSSIISCTFSIQDVTEPVQFHMKYFKCTLDSVGSCDDHETMKFDNVCDRLSEKNALWTPLLKIINPKMSCPIKKVKQKMLLLFQLKQLTLTFSLFFRESTQYATEHLICRCFLGCLLMVIIENLKNKIKSEMKIEMVFLVGFKYVTTISLYETFKNGTQPLQLLCFDSDVVVTLLSSGRPRGKG